MYKVNSTKIKIFLLSFFILGIINIPFYLFAENQIEIQEGEITVKTIPSNPQPYQNVTIEISSYSTDLNKAIITWQSGSKMVLSGIGKKSYSFIAGEVGSANNFEINIVPVGSMSSINKKVSIYPSEVELTWEVVDGYTPPFYKGKSLPITGSLIKAIAIPNTKTIRYGNGSISYKWKNNDSVVENASGYNKNSYIFKNSMFDNVNRITVEASSVAGNYNAQNTIEIPLFDSKLIFYKKSPTEGVLYGTALDTESIMTEDEITVVAEPYFMSVVGNEKDITYDWKINGETIATPSKKTELTVRPTSRGGYATIETTIQNVSELFQKVTNKLKLIL